MSGRRKRPANDPAARPSPPSLASQSQHGRQHPSAPHPSSSRPASPSAITAPSSFPAHEPAHAPGWQLYAPPPPSLAPQLQDAQQHLTISQESNTRPFNEPSRGMLDPFQDMDPKDIDRTAPNFCPSIAEEPPELNDYVCPLCWTVIEPDTVAIRRHIRERHTGTQAGAVRASKYRHACGFCCAAFESGAEWTNHVMQLTCSLDQIWLVVNQILGILRHALSNPTTVTVKSHHEFNCYMDGSKPNPADEHPQASLKDILTKMETEYFIFPEILGEVAALLNMNQICLHQVEDHRYIVSPESNLCGQCTPRNIPTAVVEQPTKRGLVPLTTPAPSEAAPKQPHPTPKHSPYTYPKTDQIHEYGAFFVEMPEFSDAELRTYADPVSGTNIDDKKKLWLNIQQENSDYRYPCPDPNCSECYPDEETLNQHIIRSHDAPSQLRALSKPKASPKPRAYTARAYKKPGAPRRPLTCPVVDCEYYNKPLSNASSKESHMRSQHPDVDLRSIEGEAAPQRTPLTCPIFGCEWNKKPFHQAQAKKRHMKNKHPSVDLDSLEVEAASQRLRR